MQAWAESVVIAPAERYVVDVSFPAPGTVALVNRVRAIDHLYGRFFDVVDTLGVVDGDRGIGRARRPSSPRLRTPGRDAASLGSLVAGERGPAAASTRSSSGCAFTGLPFVSEQLMRLDSIYFNPVEWEGTMPGMNWATTGAAGAVDPAGPGHRRGEHGHPLALPAGRPGRASGWSAPGTPCTACSTRSTSTASGSWCWR